MNPLFAWKIARVVAPLLALTLVAGLFLLLPLLSPTPPIGISADLASSTTASCTVAAPTGDVLDAAKVAAIAYRAGWRGDDIDTAVAVAHAESNWNPKATNKNNNASVDYGLFQINSIHAAILARGDWSDPGDNAAMAFKVWTDAGGKWSPWVTFWSGAYRKYLGDNVVKPKCTTPTVTPVKYNGKTYPNGQIPASALQRLWADSDHRLRPDAAQKFDALSKAYFQHFGSRPCITDSYRSLSAQYDVYRRKPGLAARPGTSNHGLGMALDLGCGLQNAGSPQDVWMHQNEKRFGWTHPSWAEPGGSKPEPWHHECSSCGAQ